MCLRWLHIKLPLGVTYKSISHGGRPLVQQNAPIVVQNGPIRCAGPTPVTGTVMSVDLLSAQQISIAPLCSEEFCYIQWL